VAVFERQLRRTLSASFMIGHQHYVSAIGRLLGTDEFVYRHVGGDRRALKMSKYDDAHQVPSTHAQSTRN